MKKYIEPRLRRDFGGVINAFLDFVKYNIKGLFNVFFNYNAVLFIIILIASYFSAKGLSGFMGVQENLGGFATPFSLFSQMDDYLIGMGITLLVYFLSSVLNSCLSATYLRLYEEQKAPNPDRKEVFKQALKRMPGVAGLLILLFLMFFVVALVALLIVIVPLLGIFAYLFVALTYFTWLSMAVFAYAYNNQYTIGMAMKESWNLLFTKFWKAVGTFFVISILIYVVMAAMQTIPTLINTYLSFNASAETLDSIWYQLFLFTYTSISNILSLFAYLLIQTGVGFLYLELNERRYNVYLKECIQQLGEENV